MKKVLIGLFIVSVFGIVGNMDFNEAQEADKRYCEMVELHKSDSSLGWPDYKNIYDELCECEK